MEAAKVLECLRPIGLRKCHAESVVTDSNASSSGTFTAISRSTLQKEADRLSARDLTDSFDMLGAGARVNAAAALGCERSRITAMAQGAVAITFGKVARMPLEFRLEFFARRLAREDCGFLRRLVARVGELVAGQ